MNIEAHRGDSAHAPENTLAAFRRALALGAASIELDIHPAADGVLVVIHDATLDRTTDGAGAVRERTADALRRFDAGGWFGAAFAGERIPLLADVMDLAGDTPLNIEIKASSPGLDVPGTLVALLRRHGRVTLDMVSSFDVEALLAARALAPELVLAPIGNDAVGLLDLALRHRFPRIHAQHEGVEAGVIGAAHARGIQVHVWTVNDPAACLRWQHMGADTLCTNRPGECLAALRDGRREEGHG